MLTVVVVVVVVPGPVPGGVSPGGVPPQLAVQPGGLQPLPWQWQLLPWQSWHAGPWQSWHWPWQSGWLQWLPMQEVEPPLQLALAKPAAATALPQTFTGTLIGAVIELPDRTETFPFPGGGRGKDGREAMGAPWWDNDVRDRRTQGTEDGHPEYKT